MRQLEWLEVDWFYTWGNVPNLGVNMAVQPEFIPQCWSGSATRLAQLPDIVATSPAALLGFNEPDHTEQSNMTVDAALAAWPKLMATELRLGAPATISPNVAWMDSFLSKAFARGYRIDFLPVHIYQYPNAGAFLSKIRTMHEKWGRPIWVTETAVADFSPPNEYRRSETLDYLQQIWQGCQDLGYVERFAWKTRSAGDPVMPTSTLFHSDGELTSLGRAYAALS